MIFLLSYSRTAIKISYLCIVKISEGMSAHTRKNYFPRALGNSATTIMALKVKAQEKLFFALFKNHFAAAAFGGAVFADADAEFVVGCLLAIE